MCDTYLFLPMYHFLFQALQLGLGWKPRLVDYAKDLLSLISSSSQIYLTTLGWHVFTLLPPPPPPLISPTSTVTEHFNASTTLRRVKWWAGSIIAVSSAMLVGRAIAMWRRKRAGRRFVRWERTLSHMLDFFHVLLVNAGLPWLAWQSGSGAGGKVIRDLMLAMGAEWFRI